MSEIFGPEGPGVQRGGLGRGNEGAAKNPPQETQPYPTGEGPKGRYMQYDNEMGAMMLELPPRFSKYKADLEEDLMDAFYGEAAGGKQQHQTINEWIAEWIKKKEEEDTGLAERPIDMS